MKPSGFDKRRLGTPRPPRTIPTEIERDALGPLADVELVSLAQPLSSSAPHGRAQGDVRVWTEEPISNEFIDGCRITITHVSLSVHIGTHVDAPRHFYPAGKTIDEYPLERFVRHAVTVHLPRSGALPVSAAVLREALPSSVQRGDIVFLYFEYARRFREHEYYAHPYLTADAARYLVEIGVSGIGTDTLTPDMPADLRPEQFDFPAHRELLGNDVLVFENLGAGLERLVGRRILVSATPLPLQGGDGAMVAPYAFVPREV